MNSNFAVDPESPEMHRQSLYAALRDPVVCRLADKAVQAAAQLNAEFGRFAEIRQALQLAETTGASVADCLRDRAGDLRSEYLGMQKQASDVGRFMAEQRERFHAEITRCTAVQFDGPQKLEALRARVRGYNRARAEMATRLREAGLDDREIQRVGIKPTPDDLAEWNREIEDVERAVRIAREFTASGPLFDVSLLSEMRYA